MQSGEAGVQSLLFPVISASPVMCTCSTQFLRSCAITREAELPLLQALVSPKDSPTLSELWPGSSASTVIAHVLRLLGSHQNALWHDITPELHALCLPSLGPQCVSLL